jgi:hypothetical protein
MYCRYLTISYIHNTHVGWNPGSTVIRATSKSPSGPFQYAETVFKTFHHNPTVRKLSEKQSGIVGGIYVMYMIGDDTAPPLKSGNECIYDSSLDPRHLEGFITMAWSHSLLGKPMVVIFTCVYKCEGA